VNYPLHRAASRRCPQGRCGRFVALHTRATEYVEFRPGVGPEASQSVYDRSSTSGLPETSLWWTPAESPDWQEGTTDHLRARTPLCWTGTAEDHGSAGLTSQRNTCHLFPPNALKGRRMIEEPIAGAPDGRHFHPRFFPRQPGVGNAGLPAQNRANPSCLTKSVRLSGHGTIVCGPRRRTSVGSNALSSSMVSVTS
jgi:hypothetical protein